MEILAAVTARLSALGYTVTETDSAALDYNIKKAETTLKVRTNQLEVPEGLFYVWADMAAGMFLTDKKASGALSEVYDFDAPAKSISEGDTSVTFAIADTGSFEDQFEAAVNKANGRDEPTEVQKLHGEPCRLSFSSISSTTEQDSAPLIQQSVKLFVSKTVEIPAGSKIVVTQEGRTTAYARSGEPAVYSCHQEIPLVPFKEYA